MIFSISSRAACSSRLAARKSWSADRAAKVRPQPGLGAADRQQLAVARLVDRVIRIGAAEETFAAPRCPAVREEKAHVRRGGEQRDGGVQIRDVHVLTAARALAPEERQDDPQRTVQTCAGV